MCHYTTMNIRLIVTQLFIKLLLSSYYIPFNENIMCRHTKVNENDQSEDIEKEQKVEEFRLHGIKIDEMSIGLGGCFNKE